jgi:DNA-binding MarR family transcriptional regulator
MSTDKLQPATTFDSLEQEVFLSLWRTYDRLRMLEDALFGRFGLTAQQYNVLRLLQAHEPEGLQTLQLAARLVSRAPDITRIVDRLAEQGWLERERRPDNRRVVAVRITAAGRDLLAAIAVPLQDCHRQQLGHLTADQLQTLCELLRVARAPHELPDSPWKT